MIYRLSLFLISSMVVQSCGIYPDELQIYQPGYSPSSNPLRTDGYYYEFVDTTMQDNGWPHQVRPMFFYEDGSWTIEPTYENLDTLAKYTARDSKYECLWGFYQIREDSLWIEAMYRGPYTAQFWWVNRRLDFSGEIYGNGDSLLMMDNVWYFHHFDRKPDSTENWMKTHRKFRIDGN